MTVKNIFFENQLLFRVLKNKLNNWKLAKWRRVAFLRGDFYSRARNSSFTKSSYNNKDKWLFCEWKYNISFFLENGLDTHHVLRR